MADHRMVIVDGVRYRLADAERRGLVPADDKTTDEAPDAQHKARRPAKRARGAGGGDS